MSFADVRKLVAILHELGFPGQISMESFRYPNFELVAECLNWLLLRYDPTIDLDLDISTDGRRVAFLKQATHIMLSGARLKLNPRRLYSADGYAVKELLKVASLLQNATNTARRSEYETLELGSSIKAFDVKATRQLVNEITKHGESLCHLLDSEPMMQETRSRAATMNMDMDEIEKGLRGAISTMLQNISSAQQDEESFRKDKQDLQSKVDKRRLELERGEERLSTLQSVRPAYMDKYEALQKDLQELFVVYSKKSCNLQWLQSQMEEHNQEQQDILDKADCRMRRLQRKLYEEELSILRGEEVGGSNPNHGSSEESDGEGTMFWKWFDGNSFKTILDPCAKSDHSPPQHNKTVESSRGLSKGPSQWMIPTNGGLKALANPILNSEFRSRSRTNTNTKDAFETEEGFKPGVSDFEASTEESDISEDGDEALETGDTDRKDTGEDNSSDDDF